MGAIAKFMLAALAFVSIAAAIVIDILGMVWQGAGL